MTMSATQYSRRHQVRFDDREREDVARAVMARIQTLTTIFQSLRAVTEPDDGARALMKEMTAEVARLRSVLERVTD